MHLSFMLLLGWDTDFATLAYKQEVEALHQHQVVNTNLAQCIFFVHTMKFNFTGYLYSSKFCSWKN